MTVSAYGLTMVARLDVQPATESLDYPDTALFEPAVQCVRIRTVGPLPGADRCGLAETVDDHDLARPVLRKLASYVSGSRLVRGRPRASDSGMRVEPVSPEAQERRSWM